MFTSTNLIIQMLKSARLNKRLAKAIVVGPDDSTGPVDVSVAAAQR